MVEDQSLFIKRVSIFKKLRTENSCKLKGDNLYDE